MGSNSRQILIAGGGIGGLAAALALGRKGIPVRVIEQAKEIGGIGYGIQLGPNVFPMFDRLGLSDTIKREADFPDAAVWYDAFSGDEVTRVEAGKGIVGRFGHPYIIIHRGDLHNILMDACRKVPSIEFSTGAAVTGFEDRGDGVTVHTAGGGNFDGAALIGADGIRSKVRAQLFGETDPHYIGWVAHRTTIPTEQVPEGINRNIVALWGGEGFHIVHYPLRHGKLFNIVTVFRTPTYAMKVDVEKFRAELLKTYERAHPLMKKLIDLTDLDWRGAVADREPIRHWTKGRVSLLGDAAHPTLQALAQGACMAIEDGVCIADLIEQCGGDFESAFAQFQDVRVERTAKVIFESRYMWKVLHPEGAERAPVHKHFRAMSRDDVWNSLAWLYNGFKIPVLQKR
jgi:salicylate hydroxylase